VSCADFSSVMRVWLTSEEVGTRASAQKQIASFFGEFTRETMLEAATHSIVDEQRDESSDRFGGGWILTQGSLQGTLVRLSPWTDGASASSTDRAAAVATCETSVCRLPEVAAALQTLAAADKWFGAVDLVHKLLAVPDLFHGPMIRGPLRSALLQSFTRVQELGIPAALLALLNPSLQTLSGGTLPPSALDDT